MNIEFSALLPFFVFVVIFCGAGIISKDFYSMPAYVAFLIALFIGFLQNKKLSFNDKLAIVAKGAGDVNIITMVLIFLVAGGVFRDRHSCRRRRKHSKPGAFPSYRHSLW